MGTLLVQHAQFGVGLSALRLRLHHAVLGASRSVRTMVMALSSRSPLGKGRNVIEATERGGQRCA